MSALLEQRENLTFSELNNIGRPTREIARSIASSQSLNSVAVDEELNIENKYLIYKAIYRSEHIQNLGFCRVDPTKVGLGVYKMKNIQTMTFFNVQLADPTSLRLNLGRNLQELIINEGNVGDAAAQAVTRSLRFRSCLRAVCFSFCGLSNDGLGAIGEALQYHSMLTEVHVFDAHLVVEEETAVVFARGVDTNTSIEKLSFAVSWVNGAGSKLILRTVATSKTLKKFSFGVIAHDFGLELSVEMGRMLSENRALETLRISGRNLPVAPMTDALARNTSLRNVTVSHLDTDGINRVCDALLRNDTVENLALSRNQITTEGILSVGRVLSNSSSSLKGLVVSKCGINDDTAIAFFGSLKLYHTLDSLDLSCNIIGDRGAVSIAAFVSSPNQVCKKIDLQGNRIGDVGFVALGKAAKQNASLEVLYLSKRDNVTERGVRAILDGVKDNSTIKDLRILPLLNLSHQDELDFYLERNKLAKPILNANLPLSIWPQVFKRADVCRHVGNRLRAPDMLYYFVKEKCVLFHRAPSSRKRKRRTNT